MPPPRIGSCCCLLLCPRAREGQPAPDWPGPRKRTSRWRATPRSAARGSWRAARASWGRGR
eukprot:4209967-Pyramimonas_sp.AAC.1